MPPADRPQRVTIHTTLQILAAFMSDLKRDDWYGRALSVHTGLGSGTVLQCLYRLENWGWLESRWEDRDMASRDGRLARRFYHGSPIHLARRHRRVRSGAGWTLAPRLAGLGEPRTGSGSGCGCARHRARGLCRRCYGRALRGLPPVDETGIQAFGQPDGYGRYGYLDVDEDGKRVLCHECGEWFASLGRHVSVTHGIPPGEYRAAHGLPRGQSLSAPALAAQRAERARARIGSASWLRMQAAAASPGVRKARVAAFREAVAGKPQQGVADRLARIEKARQLARGQRVRPVLTCSVCGALWCPIVARVRSRQTCGSRACVRALISRRARLRTQRSARASGGGVESH